MADFKLAFLVSKIHVKKVKITLEEGELLDRSRKITQESITETDELHQNGSSRSVRMLIPTKIAPPPSDPDVTPELFKETLLEELGLDELTDEISISEYQPKQEDGTLWSSNPVLKSLEVALKALPELVLPSLQLTTSNLVSNFPDSYSIYKPMLLLPPFAFISPPWAKLLSAYPADSETLEHVWKSIARSVGGTHVGVNASIPLRTQSITPQEREKEDWKSHENIIRSPVNLTPIFGDFGPPATPQLLSNPTQEDFNDAFWVTHTQNGIHQTWAPRYTMFSRGNIKEKARVLYLPSVRNTFLDGQEIPKTQMTESLRWADFARSDQGASAVDMYAGIGYFAFSYKKAGMSKVLCWELNPWSIEGLRRGARLNGWTSYTVIELPSSDKEWAELALRTKDIDFLIFPHSNERALSSLIFLGHPSLCPALPNANAPSVPPIRHINLGLLPTSRLSWSTAVKSIDQWIGGWIHAHENVGVDDIEKRRVEVVEEMQSHLDHWEGEKGACGYRRMVKCEHVERVKTYAPGVIHVVFDVWVDGVRDTREYPD